MHVREERDTAPRSEDASEVDTRNVEAKRFSKIVRAEVFFRPAVGLGFAR